MQRHNYASASDMLLNLVELCPDNPDYKSACGTALWRAGKSEEALVMHIRALAQNTSPGRLRNVAYCYTRLGRFTQAEFYWLTACELCRDDERNFHGLAMVQRHLKKLPAAEEHLYQAVLISRRKMCTEPQGDGTAQRALHAKLNYNLAGCLAEQSRDAEARLYYEQAVTFDPHREIRYIDRLKRHEQHMRLRSDSDVTDAPLTPEAQERFTLTQFNWASDEEDEPAH